MTSSSQSILSDLASFFSISSPPPLPENNNRTNNENESIEIAMTNDVPTPNNTTTPANSNTIQSTQYKEGQTVLYTNSQGLTSKATIQAIHYDNELQSYYTITFLNGRERQTDDAHLSPITINNIATNNMSNQMNVEEGVSIIVNDNLQHCGAYDMSKVDTQIISPTTTTATATESWEDNNNGGYNTPTSSKSTKRRRSEIFDYLQSKFSKRRRILFIIIGLVLVIIIIATPVSLKNKQHKQSTSEVENAPSQAAATDPIIPLPTYMPTSWYPTYSPINGWGDSSPTPPGDLFLLSGQSNIIGHSTSRQSIGKNNDYWLEIKSILEAERANNSDAEKTSSMEEELYAVIERTNNLPRCLLGCKTKNAVLSNLQSQSNTAQDEIDELKQCKQDCRSVASTLTSELLKLFNLGLLSNLDEPLTHGKCSFVEPIKDKGNGVEYISQGTVPISWNVGCGKAFGSEFMFGRTLEMGTSNNSTTTMATTYTSNFELVKNGRGGSELYKHWYPNHGLYWNELQKTISQRKGQDNTWKAFIWHQGENDAFVDDSSMYYLGNLTTFVNAVRYEMYDSSEVSTWQCKEEIPTIIIQLGHWPTGEDGDRIRDAQSTFCDEDIGRSILVTTNDLSHNYHYDAASFLVIGYRIALAYEEVMKRNVTCPY